MARKWNQKEQQAYNFGCDAGESYVPGTKVPLWYKSRREQAAWLEGFNETVAPEHRVKAGELKSA